MYGQTTVILEGMGSVSGTTAISTHEAANGFDNDPQTMTGTADVRNTSPSSGYSGASGTANIFFTNSVGRFFQIEGINTTGMVGLQLSFGILKSTSASNGSDFIVEVSSDGTTYSSLSFGPLSTGSGTAVWKKVTATGTIPATSNLRIRFRQNGTATQYRVDDVKLTGASCVSTIEADGPTTICEGNNVILTASTGDLYSWSTGATTQSINVSASGNYFVVVTDTTTDCSDTSDVLQVLVYPTPVMAVSTSDDTICAGDTVTLTARILFPDLIISEYVEGSGNEKYVEIYNGTGATVDLGHYQYQAFQNGVSLPTFTTLLSGPLADGDVKVLKNGSASLYTGAATTIFSVQHNGNDAIALVDTNTWQYVDIFGSIGHNPGTEWTGPGGYSTKDHTLRRNSNVYAGNTFNPDLPGILGFTTLTSEWSVSSIDDVSGLGSHSVSCNFGWSPATTPSTGCTVQAIPTSTGVYSATGTFFNDCFATAFTDTIVVDSCREEGRSMHTNASGTNGTTSNNVSVYPNPFNQSTTINFDVPTDNNQVLVDVIDINGKPVTNLFKGNMDSGNYRLNWDGNNNSGTRAAQGIYICRIVIGNQITTVRLIIQ
jgi:hypothetical protein